MIWVLGNGCVQLFFQISFNIDSKLLRGNKVTLEIILKVNFVSTPPYCHDYSHTI